MSIAINGDGSGYGTVETGHVTFKVKWDSDGNITGKAVVTREASPASIKRRFITDNDEQARRITICSACEKNVGGKCKASNLCASGSRITVLVRGKNEDNCRLGKWSNKCI